MTYDHWKTTEPEEKQPEEPQEWIFTFGFGQPNAGCFTRIFGTFAETRAEMFRRFGQAWSMQYPSTEEAGVEEFGLREI
jgi:hypothetical protein